MMDNPNPLLVASLDSRRHRDLLRKEDIVYAKKILFASDWDTYIMRNQNTGKNDEHSHDSTSPPSWCIERETVTEEEVFEMIRSIVDPEHPLTLEQLGVVSLSGITVDHDQRTVFVEFTPTIPHCSQATMIGLMLRVKLCRCLPPFFKVDVRVAPGTHHTEDAINKQLNDKERVAAALENYTVLNVINHGIADQDNSGVWG